MSVGDSGGVRSFGGAGGGGMAIGDAVTAGTARTLLFVDVDGNLGNATGFTFWGDGYAELIGSADGQAGFIMGNTSTNASARCEIQLDTAEGGYIRLTKIYNSDAHLRLITTTDWVLGNDASDSGVFVLSNNINLGAANVFRADGTTFEVVDVLKLNNAVTAGVGVASTNRVSINVGGTVYYFLVTTVA